MNKKEYQLIFNYEKLTNEEQEKINYIIQRLAEYNTMYSLMCESKKENDRLLKKIDKAIDTLGIIPEKDDVIKSAIEILKSND